MGIKYSKMDYVLITWQDDDLPVFGRNDAIHVIKDIAFFTVRYHSTFGIDYHYHSFCLLDDQTSHVHTISDLPYPNTFKAHQFRDGCLYITFRSHVEKVR